MNPARKHILVTGGSEGIGRSMAEIWLKQGASVTLVARTQVLLVALRTGPEGLIGTAHMKCCCCGRRPHCQRCTHWGRLRQLSAWCDSIRVN